MRSVANGLMKNNKQKCFRVHRLVADHFISNPSNHKYINHIDGIKHNNYFRNLEWCSSSHNQKHAFKNGLKNNTGKNNSNSKLTESEVSRIKTKVFSSKYYAQCFGVNQQTIRDIWNGKRWKHIK